jgi:Mga helix-turn-helix domain.
LFTNYLSRRLHVLFFFLERNETTIAEIASSLKCSKRVIKDDLIYLNEMFELQLGLSDFILSHYSGIIEINPKYKTDRLHYVYTLKLILLKQSSLFNYMTLMTTYGKITREELLNKLFVTDTYLDKMTKQLNEYLSQYHIQIKATKGFYSLIGQEAFIRLYSYIFLVDSYQFIEWPFESVSLNNIIKQIPSDLYAIFDTLSNSKKRQLTILYAILIIRTQHGNFVTEKTDADIVYIMQLLTNNFDVSSYLKINSSLELHPEIKKNEILTFNFFTRIFISDTLSKEQKVAMGATFYHETHPDCLQAQRIVQAVNQLVNHSLDETQLYMYTYFTTLYFAWNKFTGPVFLPFVYLFIPVPQFYVHVANDFMQELEQTIRETVTDKAQVRFLCSLFYSLLCADKQPILKVYLQLTKNYTAIYFVKNRLATIFNTDHIQITIDYTEADFVITDSLEYANNGKAIFYLDDLNNTKRWQALISAIQVEYLKLLEIPYD